MAISTHNKGGGDAVQLVAKRKDGSIRQILVQDSGGNVIASGYFPQGTYMDAPNWLANRKYHWVDAWSDSELLDPQNELTFTPESIKPLREEAILANMNRQIISDSLENYKRK